LDLVGRVAQDARDVDRLGAQVAELGEALHLVDQAVGIFLGAHHLEEPDRRLQGVLPAHAVAGEQRHHVPDEVDPTLLRPRVDEGLGDEEKAASHWEDHPENPPVRRVPKVTMPSRPLASTRPNG
jgi:hypothetical protein